MPWGDRTGPWGAGPMTGRGFGYCAGYPHPGCVVPGWGGRWLGRAARYVYPGWFGGWGRGWRWRNWYYLTGLPGWARWGVMYYPYAGYEPTPEEEEKFLRTTAQNLRKQLEEIEKRLQEIQERMKKSEQE